MGLKIDHFLMVGAAALVVSIIVFPIGRAATNVLLTPDGCQVASDLGLEIKPTPQKNCILLAEDMRVWNDWLRLKDGKRLTMRYVASWTQK